MKRYTDMYLTLRNLSRKLCNVQTRLRYYAEYIKITIETNNVKLTVSLQSAIYKSQNQISCKPTELISISPIFVRLAHRCDLYVMF